MYKIDIKNYKNNYTYFWHTSVVSLLRNTFKIHPRSKSYCVQNPPDQNPPNLNPPDQNQPGSKSTQFKIHPIEINSSQNLPEFKIHPSKNPPDQNQPEFFFFRNKNWFLRNFVILKKFICLQLMVKKSKYLRKK